MSGAGNVLPTVPTFAAGSPTIQQLNQLSYAVSFLADIDVRPGWFAFQTAIESVTANTWSPLSYNKVGYDSDGVFGASGTHLPYAVIVTQGFYALEACVQVEADSGTGDQFACAFRVANGGNNPHLSLGASQFFGYRGGGKMSSTAEAAADNALCLSDSTPLCLYPLDQVNVFIYPSAAKTVDYNQNTSYIQGRFSTKFTGYWLCQGS